MNVSFQEGRLAGSFKDPSGFLFVRNGKLYRQVQPSYQIHFEKAAGSGFFEDLMRDGLLIPHREAGLSEALHPGAYKVLQPEIVPFISYPYEWCFGQLRQAALATLQIQKNALERGMVLKDASAFNLQFRGAKPVWVDTLSFEIYEEGKPWQAYRQFCQHFLAPLALMGLLDLRFGKMLADFPDGIPLDFASSSLPPMTRFGKFSLHIHLQARTQFWKSGSFKNAEQGVRMSKQALLRIVNDLENIVLSLGPKRQKSVWDGYPFKDVYAPDALKVKESTVLEFLKRVHSKSVWDLGAHKGFFSAMAAKHADFVLALDQDAAATNHHYEALSNQEGVLPLVMDFVQPSPASGWENKEHLSLEGRGPCDTALALAVVHHWALTQLVPLEQIASYLSRLCRNLIIEFVPKEDPQAEGMIAGRKIFESYTRENFEKIFSRYFNPQSCVTLPSSVRAIYFMEKKTS